VGSNLEAYKKYIAPKAPGKYFKLGDGESAKVRIVSDAYVYQDNFKGKVSTRYAWVILNHAEERVQVWQAGVKTFEVIQGYALDEDWGDPTEYDLKVSREGLGTDTKYTIIASPNRQPLNDQQLKDIAAFDIFEAMQDTALIPLSDAAAGEQPPAPAARERDPIPTDEQVKDIDLDAIPF
jgi:hypothetical protein